MTEQLPAPLLPPEVDLRDFQFMPLTIAQLQQSKQWLRCKRRPELAFYSINLWMSSWHERPAASLEDDDDVLADRAMCSPEKWDKIRADVLRNWVKCSDGRLYHPVVAEKALEAWNGKVAHRDRMEAAREAKKRKKEAQADVNERSFTASEQSFTASEQSFTGSAQIPQHSAELPQAHRKSAGSASARSVDEIYQGLAGQAQSESASTIGSSAGPITEPKPPMTAPIKGPATGLKGQGQGQGQGQGESKKEPPSEDEAGASLAGKGSGQIRGHQNGHAEPDEMPLYLVRPPDGDWSVVLFRQGLAWLVRTTRNNPAGCRSLIGKWLKAAKNDHARVFALMAQAQLDRVADPRAYITAALGGKAGDFSIVSVLKEMADDERNTERRESGDDPANGNALPPPEAG